MRNSNPLISIIVPIYNVEMYIKRCIDSIINQSYQNLEIILVDDGSPDKCGAICDEYAAKDNRVKVIHKQNGGLADARNVGIGISTGEYVMFVDSDDWLETEACEKAINMASKFKADIVVFEMTLVYDNGKKIKRNKGIISVSPSRAECMKALLYKIPESGIFNNVCNKMFVRSLFDGIFFPTNKVAEDHGVIYRLIHKANKICVIDECLYNYYQRNGSISHNEFYPKIIADRNALGLERLNFIRNNYPELEKYQIARLLGDAYISIIKLNNNVEYRSLRESMVAFTKKYAQDEKKLTSYSRRIKLHYYCYPLFWLYVKLFVK